MIIKNGYVADGTGTPGFVSDIGIIGEFVAAVGDLSGAAAAEFVDADGKVVCPGFIDVHVHSELAILGGGDRYAPLRMGVTTQFAGADGFSWAPLSGERLSDIREYYRTFYDQRIIESETDISIDRLLNLWKGNIPSNLALQVPHASIRLAVMGWDARPANDEELRQMARLAEAWLEAGAKAFATGLEYEPTRHADLRELASLAKTSAKYGAIYVAHQRGYGDRVKAGCEETFAIGKHADVPVHISHFTVDELSEQLVDDALREGVDVTFDMYPYPAGCTSLLFSLPQSVQAGSLEEVRARLVNPDVRRQIEEHLRASFPADRVRFASVGIPNTGWEGKSVAEVCELLGVSLADAVCDILLQSNFQTLMIYHWPEERYGFLEKTFRHPRHMVSTDGIYVGEKPHPRGFGTFPKVLREFVYEKKWLSLEQAVWKMSGFPAKRFNLDRRGTLRSGNFADIVVFDPGTIYDGPTFHEPRSPNRGIEHVWVNGRRAIQNGVVVEGNFGMIV